MKKMLTRIAADYAGGRLHCMRRLCLCAMSIFTVVGCGGPNRVVTPSPTPDYTVTVIETSVRPLVDGKPVVAFHLRATPLIGNRGLGLSADVALTKTSVAAEWETCDTPYVNFGLLQQADAGTVFPMLFDGVKEGELKDGWVTFRAAASYPRGCLITLTLSSMYLPVTSASPVTFPRAAPIAERTLATVQVRWDGSTLDRPPFETPTPEPTLSLRDQARAAILAQLQSAVDRWRDDVSSVVMDLPSPPGGLAHWGTMTSSDRSQLKADLDVMGKVMETVPDTLYLHPVSELVIGYAEQLDGLNGLAFAGRGGTSPAAAWTELRHGIKRVQTAVGLLLDASRTFVQPDQATYWRQVAADGVDLLP